MEASWTVSRESCAILERSLSNSGPSWNVLGASWPVLVLPGIWKITREAPRVTREALREAANWLLGSALRILGDLRTLHLVLSGMVADIRSFHVEDPPFSACGTVADVLLMAVALGTQATCILQRVVALGAWARNMLRWTVAL